MQHHEDVGQLPDELFYTLTPNSQERIRALWASPSPESWDQAYGAVVNGAALRRTTLWEHLFVMDEDCPLSLPEGERRSERWGGYFPSRLSLRRALEIARHERGSELRTAITNRVQWTALADTYVPVNLRDQFVEEAESSRWVRAAGKHPMSPGLGIQEAFLPAVRDIGLPVESINYFCYSEDWTVREDNHQVGPYVCDRMIDATILGVRSDLNDMRFYGLDIGTGVAPVLLVDDKPVMRIRG